jgi:acetyl esterase/lipase
MTIVEKSGVQAGTIVPLWPDGAPGSEGLTSAEIFEPAEEGRSARVRNIHNPSLTVFLAPPETATGAAAIVAPGGGHRYLAIEHEGYHVASYLNSIGVSAFILKYRLANEEGSRYQVEIHALADAQRAIRTVRHRAGEWRVDPGRVLMVGFSAGAGVTLLAGAAHDGGQPGAADPIERQGCRPDYVGLIYGGGRQLDQVTFTADTPPTFLCGADDDKLVTDAFPKLYAALKEAGVPTELHVYASGGHGFGIRPNPKPFPSARSWHHRLADWLEDRGALTNG